MGVPGLPGMAGKLGDKLFRRQTRVTQLESLQVVAELPTTRRGASRNDAGHEDTTRLQIWRAIRP